MSKKHNKGSLSLHSDRRTVLVGGTAAVGAVSLGLSVTALAQTPPKGGKFVVGISNGASTDTLDPATFSSALQIFLGYSLRNNLTEIGSDGSLKPELAESWESDDAKTWSFKLRNGVVFHNGKSLDANDVVESLKLHLGPDSASGAASLLEAVTSVAADGNERVTVELSQANADFPFILSDYHFNILPVGSDGSLDTSGVGTGGYVLENYDPGVRTLLTRNDGYWKEGAAFFDAGEVVLINDPTARGSALMSGDIDAINEADTRTAALMADNSDVIVESVPSGFHPTFAMRTDMAPFDNNDVRLALKYGIDRQALVDIIQGGYGSVANDQPIAPSMPFYDPSLEQRPYDPDRAKHHLKEAGLESLQVQLSAADGIWPGCVDAATMYREQAMPSGIDIEVIREPNDGYWSDVWLVKPFVSSAWGARPTADMIFTQAYAAGGAWNETAFENARFNELLVAARAELDDSKRAEMYSEMQRLVHDNSGAVIPFFRNHVYARRTSIEHSGQLASNWQLDGYKAMERWWAAG